MKNIGIQTVALPFLLIILLTGSSFTTFSHRWEHLGSRTVTYRADRDVVKVTARGGAFKKIKVEVTDGALNMNKILIQYGNGEKQVIRVRNNFVKGSNTRLIDLKGNKRIIRDITFFYNTKKIARKRAKVHVYGKH